MSAESCGVAVGASRGTNCNRDLVASVRQVLSDAGNEPGSGLPIGFTYRELAMIVYALRESEPTASQLSAVRRVGAGLLKRGEATKSRRHTAGVELRRKPTQADRAARVEAMRPVRERAEAERKATPYPIDTGYAGIVEVPIEPVLIIRESGVELRASEPNRARSRTMPVGHLAGRRSGS